MPDLKKGEWRCYACADGYCINDAGAERCWYCNADQDGIRPASTIADDAPAECNTPLVLSSLEQSILDYRARHFPE